MIKKSICIAIALILVFSAVSVGIITATATQYPANGNVKQIVGVLRVRATPSTSAAILGNLTSGASVVVLGETDGTVVNDTAIWYKIEYGSGIGYIHSSFVEIQEPIVPPSATDDPEFEAYLDSQNFPESYRPYLRALHKKYPNWKFTALHTGLSWAKVVAAEYQLHDSLIDKSTTSAWKSYDSGRYNFTTSTFITFDGGAYHAASKEYLSYCLDPRNFLGEGDVLMFFVAHGQAGETASGATKILSGLNWAKSYPGDGEVVYIYEDGTYDIIIESATVAINEDTSSDSTSSDNISSDSTSSDDTSSDNTSSDGTSSGDTSSGDTSSEPTTPEVFVPTKPVAEKIEIDSYGTAFYAAHKLTGISAYMLASRIRQEQGVNGNPSGTGKVEGYEGYYNLWNIKTVGDNKYVQGATHAKEQGWDTPLKSIIGGSSWLNINYFKTGQDTLYLQKYDVVDGGNGYYWHEYMTYLPAPWQEAKILKMAFTEETMQNEAVFKIPVYLDMPSSAVECPSSTGTNNNYLKGISINGTPIESFSVYTQSYTDIFIKSETNEVEIIATPYDSGAVTAGGGNLTLDEGMNTVNIAVTASNGAQRNYTVSVIFELLTPEPEPEPEPEPGSETPIISGTVYNIGDYITGVEPKTNITTFAENLGIQNGSVKIFAADGTEKTGEALVATGDKVTIYNTDESEYISYNIVIYGDCNGDGRVSSYDLMIAQRHILKIESLEGLYLKAADSNKDSRLSSVDLLTTQRFILGMDETIQGE